MDFETPQLPSNRRFGVLFVAVFALIGLNGIRKHWPAWAWVSLLAASGLVGVVLVVAPGLLAPFNRAWFVLGQRLGRVVSPIALGVLYFLVLAPVALVTRLAGRDVLRLRPVKADTFWRDRVPPGPPGESFKRQF